MALRFHSVELCSRAHSAFSLSLRFSVNGNMTELKTYVRAKKRPPSPSPSPPAKQTRRRTVRRRPLPAPETPAVVEGERAIGGEIEDFGEDEIEKIRASQLGWYDRNHRELPWRRNPSEDEKEGTERESRAYGVWVSELMLQQTRVQTVIDYYNRWMRKWPTIDHLAQASLEEVNEMWAGLGYYRRARFLLEGAKMIVAEGGGFPRTISSLRKVPGIGEYTAGAIASIAFKEVVPVVDGNVVRVLSRLKAISANPKDKMTIKSFWKLAAQLVDPFRPGDFNQSLMELGATICTPLNPSCSSCPIATQCRALSNSKLDKSVLVTDYPSKVVKVKQRHEFSAVCVVEILGGEDTLEGNRADSRFLLVKRPDGGLLAGLWEFPSVLVGEDAEVSTRRKVIDSFLKKTFKLDLGKTCSIVSREHVGEFVHIFSHIRLKCHVELLVLHRKGGVTDLLEQDESTMLWKCVDGKTLSTIGLTSGVRKVHNLVQKFKGTPTGVVQVREKPNLKKQKHS